MKKILVIGLFVSFLAIIYLFTQTKNSSVSKMEDQTQTNTECNRKEMYDIPPEFSRALSLLEQRLNEKISFLPCVDIQYSNIRDFNEAEGVFIFDSSKANANHLPIFVDNSYKESDDLVTAILLSHELKHAAQFIEVINGNDRLSCMDKEVEAFLSQINFVTKLNAEEQNSLASRMNNKEWEIHPQLALMKDFLILSRQVATQCGGEGKCIGERFLTGVQEGVYSNPGYIEQCSL